MNIQSREELNGTSINSIRFDSIRFDSINNVEEKWCR